MATLSAALTAGVMDKFGGTQVMRNLSLKTGFADKLAYNFINATARSLTNSAITGDNLQDALQQGWLSSVVDTTHGQVASKIKLLESDYLLHKIAHAAAGCAAGAASGGSCKDGAVGAAVGEIVAEMMPPKNGMFYTDSEKKNVLAMSKLVAGASTAYTGGNAQTAINAADTAVQNNAFAVPALVALLPTAAAGGGNPVLGLQNIGEGTDPLSKAMASGGQATVQLLMNAYPKETATTLNFLNSVSDSIDATIKYLDEKTGQVVSTQWNNLSPEMRNTLIGAKTVVSLVITPGAVQSIKTSITSPRPEAPTPTNAIQKTGTADGNASALHVQQKRTGELIGALDGRNGITVGDRSYLPRSGENVPIYDGVGEKQVKQYFQELTGTKGLPAGTPQYHPDGTLKGTMWKVPDGKGGTFTLRDFAKTTNKSGPVWTIDVPRSMLPSNYKGSPEIKFSR